MSVILVYLVYLDIPGYEGLFWYVGYTGVRRVILVYLDIPGYEGKSWYIWIYRGTKGNPGISGYTGVRREILVYLDIPGYEGRSTNADVRGYGNEV